MAGVVRLWNNWEVQILVLVSFVLQVFLLMFAGMRRRNISIVPRTLLWLAYLLADFIAVYILGHMSFCSKSHEKQQLMAFWAPFLLVHLGGQDTITAYSIEDNQLWLRHLLNFSMQALGVAYALYKYIAGSWTLVTAAALIFVTGLLKYGERIWALKSSRLDNMSKFLDGMKSTEAERLHQTYRPAGQELGPEEVLQGAHDLLPICMGQFVDYKFWPSPFQCEAIELFCDKDQMYELIGMQLSLVHDFLYTKATVVFTWYGCFIRAISSVATITAFFLFRSSIAKDDLDRGDVIVTYILISGAVLLEMIALLKAMGSTWACALLRARKWDRLHNIVISVRRHVKAGEKNRRWSGSIGQPKSLHGNGRGSGGWIRKVARWFELEYSGGCKDLLHRSLAVISHGTKELVLGEVRRMVLECDGKEGIMRSYSGQCALNSGQHALNPWRGLFEDPTSRAGIDFDDRILAWYFATKMFLSLSSGVEASSKEDVVEAIRTVSNYMIFLVVERPYMLPSPVRTGSYANIEAAYVELSDMKYLIEYFRRKRERDIIRAELEELYKRREGVDEENINKIMDDIKIKDDIKRKSLLQELDRIDPELEELDKRREGLDPKMDRRSDAIVLKIIGQELDRILPEMNELTGRWNIMAGWQLKEIIDAGSKWEKLDKIRAKLRVGHSPPPALARAAQLVESLLYMEGRDERKVLQVVLGVWVEMLCYAAHHCNRDSHARQLNSGGEFITIIWLLSTAMFNRRYQDWFKEGVQEFFNSPVGIQQQQPQVAGAKWYLDNGASSHMSSSSGSTNQEGNPPV